MERVHDPGKDEFGLSGYKNMTCCNLKINWSLSREVIEDIECIKMASMPIVKKEPRKSFGFLDTKRDRFHDEAWAAVEGDLISNNIYMYNIYVFS